MREDLRVEARLRNNVLWHAIFDGYPTVAAFCRAHDGLRIHQSRVGGFLNLTESPFNRRGELLPLALRVCTATGVEPDALFPSVLYSGLFPTTAVREVSAASCLAMGSASARLALPPTQDDVVGQREMAESIDTALKTLTFQEEKYMRRRFGLDGKGGLSQSETAALMGFSHSRASQIERAALWKLRHPSRSRHTRHHWNDLVGG